MKMKLVILIRRKGESPRPDYQPDALPTPSGNLIQTDESSLLGALLQLFRNKMAVVNNSLLDLIVVDYLPVHVRQELLLFCNEMFEVMGLKWTAGTLPLAHLLQLSTNPFLQHLQSVFTELEVKLRQV